MTPADPPSTTDRSQFGRRRWRTPQRRSQRQSVIL